MDALQSDSSGARQSQAAVGDPAVLRDLLPMAMWALDSEGHIVQWALAAEDLLGYEPQQVLGRDGMSLLVPEAYWELAREAEATVQAGGTVVSALPVRHRDGHLVEMEMWVCPITDPRGGPGMALIAAETSAVRQMRDALAAMEGLFSQSPIGLAMFDPGLRSLRVNDALARMNGLPAAGHVGRRVAEMVPGVDSEVAETVMRQVLDTGRAVVDVRYSGRTMADPDHDRVWSCSYAPLVDRADRQLGLIASLIDITAGQQAHIQAERAQQRLSLLAEAGERIGTTLDLRQTADELAEMLVPQLADMADVYLLEGVLAPDPVGASAHGLLRRLAIAFGAPAAPVEELAVDMTYQVPPRSVYAQILAEGHPQTLTEPLPLLATALAGPRSDRLHGYCRTHLGSARVIPLVARDSVLGLVVAGRPGDEPYDEQDEVLLDGLVARAALNIDNARLYTSQRQAALTLQRSLMSTLPQASRLELAGRYRPASKENEVGGDWYDVIALPDGKTGLVIGDVMGHGIHAAAVMGQLRTVVRTLASQDIPPVRLLQLLDATVADLGADEMATCAYAVYDPATSSCLVARAGHPPPAVAHAGGAIQFLDGPCGTPLGVGGPGGAGGAFQVERVPLPRHSLLVLYTDGLIEGHDRDLDEGLHDLADALGQPSGSLDEICDCVLARLLPSQPQDDVAMLLARPL